MQIKKTIKTELENGNSLRRLWSQFYWITKTKPQFLSKNILNKSFLMS